MLASRWSSFRFLSACIGRRDLGRRSVRGARARLAPELRPSSSNNLFVIALP